MARIHLVTEIAAPPEICFDAARDVTVHLASWPAHTAVAGVRTGPMQLGDEVTWRAPHFGIAFASPLGPLGRVVDHVVLQRFMAHLLREHNAAVAREASNH